MNNEKGLEREAPKKEFKVGDIVRLVSGGPKMAVCHPDLMSPATSSNPTLMMRTVWCQWFGSNGEEIRSGAFHPDTLEKASYR